MPSSILVPAVTLLALLATSVARADGEACDDATPLRFPARVELDTLEVAPAAAPSSCAAGDVYARWFVFTAPAEDRYTIMIEESALADTTIELWSACDAAAPLACSDDQAFSLQARVDLWLVADERVFVRVAGWGGTRGALTLRVDTVAAVERPPNDACEDAPAIVQGYPAATATWNATGADLSSCGPEDAADVWYRFTAPTAGDYEFEITQNLLYAHYLTVFDGCAAEHELACGFLEARATLEAGQEVWLRVGTNPIVADWFNVAVRPDPPAITPPNDHFTDAIPVTVGSSTLGSTRGADREAMNYGPDCGPYINGAIWYSFEAPDDDHYVFDTNGSELADTVLAILDACDSNGGTFPQLFGCNDDDGAGEAARLDGFMEAGTRVCIAVAGHYLSEEGEVRLNVSRLGARPPNDDCAGALPITVGPPVLGVNIASEPSEPPSAGCPWDVFALWYTFEAPADGLYKFDTKAVYESWPDIALYATCEATETLACSVEAQPAVHLEMRAGDEVRVRVSTSVWWRGTVPLRVGPVREGAGDGDGGDGEETGPEVVETVETVEVVEVVEAADTSEEVDVVEDVAEPGPEADDVEVGAEIEAEPGPEARDVDATGGCGGCAGGGGGLGALAWLALGLALRSRVA
ncbi:MAG: hypothetical protein IT385_16845 [Deltaproteobacteria bacterium]|nr:hypothetical protein [Deltaproteobacteria bacterium]